MTAPYPSDTRAKGWRFELDYEQVEQSSTWALAPAEVKPWLLMLWLTAWKQTPCGSLPTDLEVVAAMIGMPPKLWAKHSKILLRGWKELDGRLYHDTLTARVTEMMARRHSESDRKAKERARKAAEAAATPPVVTPESRVTTTGLHPESSTGTGTITEEEKEKSKPSAWMTVEQLCQEGLSAEVAKAFIDHRRSKKAKLTPLAWSGLKAAAITAGWEIEAAVLKAIHRSWTTFDASFVAGDKSSFRERDASAAQAEVSAWTGGKLGRKSADVIDMEALHALGNR